LEMLDVLNEQFNKIKFPSIAQSNQ
jgi:hypothetical protein